MHRHIKLVVGLVLIVNLVLALDLTVFGRGGGGGGRGGGGGGRGGGGGGFGGGGGGGMSRPSSVGRSPSMSRPSGPSRPAGGASRPSTGARPGGGAGQAARPPGLTPGSRPGTVDFSRPGGSGGIASRPSIGQGGAGNRPGIVGGARPSQLPAGQRPGPSQLPGGQRPGGQGPGIATRPSLPGGSTALLPGLGNRPGGGNRPGVGDRPGGGNRPSQLPARTPQERRGDLADRLGSRDQIGGGNRLDGNRQDWQDRYQNISDRHDNWHHGFWHGNGSGWWNHMWSEHTALMAFGTTMWGLNRLAYGFGYWGYANPYSSEPYAVDGGATIDYSQPIDESAPVSDQASQTGMTDFDAARQAFYQGDYAAAMTSTNKALATLPNDAIIHEFRALVLFAQGKYKESAAGLYSVLAVGPGWDWTTLVSLYPNVDVYTKQLRALEAQVRAQPDVADTRFVLAYHFLTQGFKDAAAIQLKVAHQLLPQDVVVKELLLMTAGPDAIAAPSAPAAPKPNAPAVKATDLVGTWAAVGQNNKKFTVELTKEGNFSWTYSEGVKKQTVKGVYALDGNVLAMEPESGGVMTAEVTQPQNGQFEFQLLGAPPDDAGLKFGKAG